MDMAVWTIAASTLKNLDLPRADDGALVVVPEIKWGAGRVLAGSEFALLLPADSAVPGFGSRHADGHGGPSTRAEGRKLTYGAPAAV
jgi:hypothetical protein